MRLSTSLFGLAALSIALSPAALASPTTPTSHRASSSRSTSLSTLSKLPTEKACARLSDKSGIKDAAPCIAYLLQEEVELRFKDSPNPNTKYLEQLKKIIKRAPPSFADKPFEAAFYKTSLSAAISSLEKYFAAKGSGRSGILSHIFTHSKAKDAKLKASKEAYFLTQEHYYSIRRYVFIANTLFQAPDLLQIKHDSYTYQAHLVTLGSMALEFSRNERGYTKDTKYTKPAKSLLKEVRDALVSSEHYSPIGVEAIGTFRDTAMKYALDNMADSSPTSWEYLPFDSKALSKMQVMLQKNPTYPKRHPFERGDFRKPQIQAHIEWLEKTAAAAGTSTFTYAAYPKDVKDTDKRYMDKMPHFTAFAQGKSGEEARPAALEEMYKFYCEYLELDLPYPPGNQQFFIQDEVWLGEYKLKASARK